MKENKIKILTEISKKKILKLHIKWTDIERILTKKIVELKNVKLLNQNKV
jgi:hypothetical protein